ncbi:Neuropilin and tolloid-like protein 1 [Collichthys lucidus]|uniref:Neuropilin and tolloid-like protein 1 n=1 Tax=Collichthys lucidus TaxID=240159 RepID=A0A4U5VIZ6_COLLU|nr:Neuropilin and tolloid-like protein 1 [Collichthys lucidus]
MANSNECKRNFVAVYDGGSSVEDLKSKFCSTVANDIMLVSTLGVIRMWADEASRKSRFRILFTTYQEHPLKFQRCFARCFLSECSINATLRHIGVIVTEKKKSWIRGRYLKVRVDRFNDTNYTQTRNESSDPEGQSLRLRHIYISSLRRSPARPQPLEQHPPPLSSTAPTLSAVNVYQGQEVTEDRVPSKLDSSADQLVLGILRRIKLNMLGYMGNHCLITKKEKLKQQYVSPCDADAFFCHSNMCINNTLVCNGMQNCVYPWDESQCKEKRKANILDNLNNTNGTIIGVTCCIVLILLIVSVIVQIKQPRKKYILRREDFDPTMFQEVFEPPHYELCTLRSATAAAAASADLVDLAEDFENYHALRRASSRCVHDHHCGSSSNPGSAHISQLSLSGRGSRGNLSARDAAAATLLTDLPQPPMSVRPLLPATGNRRSILVMKHSYSQEAADNGCDLDDDLEEVPTTSHRLSRHEKAVQRSVSIDF